MHVQTFVHIYVHIYVRAIYANVTDILQSSSLVLLYIHRDYIDY